MNKTAQKQSVSDEPPESPTPPARHSANHHHLPKREIIKKSDDFTMIIQTGQKWTGRHLMVFYLPSDERRVGFAVSKKLGNAVVRNQVKRWMREVYRVRKHEIGSLQMIMMLKKQTMKPGFHQIAKDMDRFINEAEIR